MNISVGKLKDRPVLLQSIHPKKMRETRWPQIFNTPNFLRRIAKNLKLTSYLTKIFKTPKISKSKSLRPKLKSSGHNKRKRR